MEQKEVSNKDIEKALRELPSEGIVITTIAGSEVTLNHDENSYLIVRKDICREVDWKIKHPPNVITPERGLGRVPQFLSERVAGEYFDTLPEEHYPWGRKEWIMNATEELKIVAQLIGNLQRATSNCK